jgi:hypothetical protein
MTSTSKFASLNTSNKDEFTKQALRDLSVQMQSFDFGKSRKKSRTRKSSESDDPDYTPIEIVSESSDEEIEKKQKKRRRVSKKKDKNNIGTSTVQMLIQLQKQVENMKHEIESQVSEIDKHETDKYYQRLELGNLNIELEDTRASLAEARTCCQSQEAYIKKCKYYLYGTVSTCVLLVANTVYLYCC